MEWGLRHHSEIYAGCQKFASEANWETSIIPSSHKALETQFYDGIIARTGNRLHDTALKNGIPLVNVWQNSPAKEAVSVFTNTEKAGAMATEHLIGRGLQRFGYMGYYRDVAAVKHLKGFKKTLQQNGFDCSAFQFHRTSIEGKSAGWEKFTSDLKD
jgi:DNA-binding LacI/PurR family transcriptional regulator